jgi:uncharacterized membrane protein
MRTSAVSRAAWSVALLVGLAACAAPSGLEEELCPPESELTYDSFGQLFFAAHCDRCHAADAPSRNGAPRSITFDSLEEIARRSDRIFARSAGDNTSMPPGPDDVTAEERELLAEWLACGAP